MCDAAVGCPDFTIPSKAKLKRQGDLVTVTCEEDPSQTWQRKCVGTQWEGELGTCPAATGASNEPPGPLPIGERICHYLLSGVRSNQISDVMTVVSLSVLVSIGSSPVVEWKLQLSKSQNGIFDTVQCVTICGILACSYALDTLYSCIAQALCLISLYPAMVT